MVRRKRNTMRKKQKGGFWSPFSSDTEDPNASKSGFFENIGSYFSSATDKANAGLGTAASSITDSASSLSSSVSSSVSSLNPFAKKETTNTSTTNYETSSTPITTSPTTNYETSSTPTASYGGKRRRVKRGGSYSANMSQTNLAATASPISGIQTVKAQTWVGGKTKRRRRRHKHNKSCKHRK